MIADPEPRFLIVDALSLHPDELYIYGRKEWIKEPLYTNKRSLLNLKDNKRKKEISDKSKQKIKRAAKYLLYQSSVKTAYNYKTGSTYTFKVNFITLTLSAKQIHSDQIIKSQLLNQFLIEAKKKWHIKNYVWRAEKQKNGNIHFHILTDQYIPWSELRSTWNRIQNKLDYINEFERKNHHRNPNSTDIHSLRKVENVAAYVTKYMTKNEDDLNIVGENWRASKELTDIKGARIDINEGILKEIERLQNKPESRRIDKEYFSGIFFNNKFLTREEFPLLTNLFDKYIVEIFGFKEQIIFNSD